MKIYLIRHAEAKGNLYKRFHGQFDSNLTPFGRAQLVPLEEYFKDKSVDNVYASDLKRAVSTAKAVADVKGLEVQKIKELKEIHMGILEDASEWEVENIHGEVYKKYKNDPVNFTIPKGENLIDATNRVYNAIEKLAISNEGKSIAIVSHGKMIDCFLRKIQNIGLEEKISLGWCDNVSVTTIEYKETFEILELFKRTSYLENPFTSEKWNTVDKDEIPIGISLEFRKLNEIKTEIFFQDKKCGYCIFDLENSTEDTGKIGYIELEEKFRNLGFAPEIIGYFSTEYRKIGKKMLSVSVCDENIRALRFFEKIGFESKDESMELILED